MWVQNEGLGAFAAQRVGGPVRRLVIAIITATPFPIELPASASPTARCTSRPSRSTAASLTSGSGIET